MISSHRISEGFGFFLSCRRRYHCVFLFCLQLPHMPHISECLMKRSLKPTDLRDMTLGQLQVIVNDLHSQIESECVAHMRKPLTSIFFEYQKWARRQMGKNTLTHTDPYPLQWMWKYFYASQFKGLYLLIASPEHLPLPQYKVHWSWYSGMNNFSFKL